MGSIKEEVKKKQKSKLREELIGSGFQITRKVSSLSAVRGGSVLACSDVFRCAGVECLRCFLVVSVVCVECCFGLVVSVV